MLVKIYTDGAARGNPDGPGGYGCVLSLLPIEMKSSRERTFRRIIKRRQITGWN